MATTTFERKPHTTTLALLCLSWFGFFFGTVSPIPGVQFLRLELHTNTTWAAWVVNAFQFVAAIAAPLLGKVADHFGTKKVMILCCAAYSVGSVGAILQWHIWNVIAWRGVQGFGAAIIPLSISMVKDEFPHDRVSSSISKLTAAGAVGTIAAVLVPGLIADHASVRYIFVPGALTIGTAGILIALCVRSRPGKTTAPIDMPGAFVLSAGLVALLTGITEGNTWGWTSWPTVRLLLLGGAILGSWVVLELRVREPLIDIRMLTNRNVFLTNLSIFSHSFAFFGVFIVVTTYVTTPRGLSASAAAAVHYGFGESGTVAGLFLVPGAILGTGLVLVGGRLAHQVSQRRLLLSGVTLTFMGGLILLRFNDRPWEVIGALALLFGGSPLIQGAQAHLIVDAVRPWETGAASGVSYVARMLGNVVAGQVAAATLAAHTLAGGSGVPAKSAFVAVFVMCVVASLTTATACLFVRGSAPRLRAPATAAG